MGGRDQKAVCIDLLGPLQVSVDGIAVDVGGPKVQTMLVMLAHQPGDVVGRDTLSEALWGDTPPKSARSVIQARFSGLRQVLGPSCDLRYTSDGYLLDPKDVGVDALDFEQLVDDAKLSLASDPATAIALTDQALALWRGEPVASLLDIRSLEGRLATLREVRVRAQTIRLDALLRVGQHERCCTEAEALANEHPYRENIRGLHMLALYRSGRQTDALRAFRHTRDVLVEELGIEPGPQLQTLHHQILDQDDCLNLIAPQPPTEQSATATPSTDNLRAEPNVFVERPEIDAVIEALGPGRVVTVVGAGGIGKSRAVAAAARRYLGDVTVSDGIWIVDLAPLPEGSDDVAVQAAAAMALGRQPGVSALATITSYLQARRVLLVLDNCEHVATSAAVFADTVAARCSGTSILAASRVRLAIAPERVITLDRLSDETARELLAARIAEVGAGPFGAEECGHLCDVLDNYPLAIELAAARTRSLSPREISARLGEQPRLLSSWADNGATSGTRRHADLATALDWSIDQLSPQCRATLDRATVFVSDFDLDTAEAVLATDTVSATNIAEDLGELVEHHLISRDHARARFRVLEPIRQHLHPDESTQIRGRYAAHFGQFAMDAAIGIRGPDEAIWWNRWRAELPHVREAIRLAIDAGDIELIDAIMAPMALTISICVMTEPGEWAINALRQLHLEPADAPGIAAAAAAQFARLDLVDECDALLEPLQELQDDPWTQTIVSCVGLFREPSDRGWADRLYKHAEACGDQSALAVAKMCRGDIDAVDFADRQGNPTLRTFARQWRSALILTDKHSIEARTNKEEIYRIALTSNNEHTIVEGQTFMALQHCFDDDPHRAGPLCVELIERAVRVRSPHWVWHCVEVIANMLAMVRMDPRTSQMLWAAVDASGRPPFSRVTRDPNLPVWVASQLTEQEQSEAVIIGSTLGMDEAAIAARKAGEQMATADR